jgi:ATP-dependent RNA helicase DDX27
MAPTFIFEAPSDEELDLHFHGKGDDDDEQEEAQEEEEEERAPNRKSQSPWDFGSYSESVAEEHARRSTTSVDFKISKALQNRSVAISNEDSDSAESELDKQVTKPLSLSLCLSLYQFKIRKFNFCFIILGRL